MEEPAFITLPGGRESLSPRGPEERHSFGAQLPGETWTDDYDHAESNFDVESIFTEQDTSGPAWVPLPTPGQNTERMVRKRFKAIGNTFLNVEEGREDDESEGSFEEPKQRHTFSCFGLSHSNHGSYQQFSDDHGGNADVDLRFGFESTMLEDPGSPQRLTDAILSDARDSAFQLRPASFHDSRPESLRGSRPASLHGSRPPSFHGSRPQSLHGSAPTSFQEDKDDLVMGLMVEEEPRQYWGNTFNSLDACSRTVSFQEDANDDDDHDTGLLMRHFAREPAEQVARARKGSDAICSDAEAQAQAAAVAAAAAAVSAAAVCAAPGSRRTSFQEDPPEFAVDEGRNSMNSVRSAMCERGTYSSFGEYQPSYQFMTQEDFPVEGTRLSFESELSDERERRLRLGPAQDIQVGSDQSSEDDEDEFQRRSRTASKISHVDTFDAFDHRSPSQEFSRRHAVLADLLQNDSIGKPRENFFRNASARLADAQSQQGSFPPPGTTATRNAETPHQSMELRKGRQSAVQQSSQEPAGLDRMDAYEPGDVDQNSKRPLPGMGGYPDLQRVQQDVQPNHHRQQAMPRRPVPLHAVEQAPDLASVISREILRSELEGSPAAAGIQPERFQQGRVQTRPMPLSAPNNPGQRPTVPMLRMNGLPTIDNGVKQVAPLATQPGPSNYVPMRPPFERQSVDAKRHAVDASFETAAPSLPDSSPQPQLSANAVPAAMSGLPGQSHGGVHRVPPGVWQAAMTAAGPALTKPMRGAPARAPAATTAPLDDEVTAPPASAAFTTMPPTSDTSTATGPVAAAVPLLEAVTAAMAVAATGPQGQAGIARGGNHGAPPGVWQAANPSPPAPPVPMRNSNVVAAASVAAAPDEEAEPWNDIIQQCAASLATLSGSKLQSNAPFSPKTLAAAAAAAAAVLSGSTQPSELAAAAAAGAAVAMQAQPFQARRGVPRPPGVWQASKSPATSVPAVPMQNMRSKTTAVPSNVPWKPDAEESALRIMPGHQGDPLTATIGSMHDVDAAARCQSAGKVPAPDFVKLGEARTLMVRNIPVRYSQDMLLKEWPNNGEYDFLYLPICIGRKGNVSFAFINFVTAEAASEFHTRWHKQRLQHFSARKPLDISPAHVQGRDDNLIQIVRNKTFRIRNIHFQPAIFEGNVRINMEDFLQTLDLRLKGQKSHHDTLNGLYAGDNNPRDEFEMFSATA